jgi:hypothetical protein
MAQTGYEQPQQGDAAPKVSGESARQGQNIKGMVWVLIVGTLLVVGAYGVMLALQQQPNAVVNESRNEAASAPTTDVFPSTPSQTAPQPTQ